VRRAALSALARCAPGSPAIARALRSRRQPLAVRELAAALVAARGGPGAAAALAAALDDVLTDPAADERSAGLAIACLHGLGRTGDTSDPILEALGAAAHEPLSAPVRAAAMEAIGRLCPQGAAPALRRGAQDPDAAVRRAAQAALTACQR
jgi:HEAT repeat protein